jgi:hypothetical protein
MAKQITFLILFLGLYVANVFSQGQLKSLTGTNLYERALSACVTEQLTQYGDQGSETRLRLMNRIIERNDLLTDKLPTQVGEIKIEYLDRQAIIDRYRKKRDDKKRDKESRAEIPVSVISPIWNEGTILKISLRDWYVSYKKRVFNYALEGGCIVDFKFDSQLDDFAITKTDLWGV